MYINSWLQLNYYGSEDSSVKIIYVTK